MDQQFLYSLAWIMIIAAMLLSFYAQSKIGRVYNQYFRVKNHKGITGKEVARQMLDRHGLYDVSIRVIPGYLTDNYDPSSKVMNLSEGVCNGDSISSIGVAAHETGHAIQHGEEYGLMKLRGAIAPVAVISSRIVFLIFIAGIVMQMVSLTKIAVVLYFVILLFQLVTLPVEYDASRRALVNLEEMGYITQDEISPVQKVLGAAILTYLAATLATLGQFLRLLSISKRER